MRNSGKWNQGHHQYGIDQLTIVDESDTGVDIADIYAKQYVYCLFPPHGIDERYLCIQRVCVYARVSTDSRRQEDLLENHTETYERLIKGNPEYEFAGVYADQGISGYYENRAQFQKMLERARAGEIDLIITKSISRFARNTVTVLKFARELK